jgi:capsular polysaccharide biosynthesis protein
MKRREIIMVVIIGFFTAIIAFLLSTIIFKSPQHRSTKVPVAGSIDTNFPDIRHDSNYNTIFNDKALDPAVPLNASTNPNNQPFLGSQ